MPKETLTKEIIKKEIINMHKGGIPIIPVFIIFALIFLRLSLFDDVKGYFHGWLAFCMFVLFFVGALAAAVDCIYTFIMAYKMNFKIYTDRVVAIEERRGIRGGEAIVIYRIHCILMQNANTVYPTEKIINGQKCIQ